MWYISHPKLNFYFIFNIIYTHIYDICKYINIHKKILIDRPKTRWKDEVEKDIKILGKNIH